MDAKVQEYVEFYKTHNRHPVMNDGKDERRLRQWVMQVVCYSRYDGHAKEKAQLAELKEAGVTDVEQIALSRQLGVLDELITFWNDNKRVPRQCSESSEHEQKLARWRLNKVFKRSPELNDAIRERKVEFLFEKEFGVNAQKRVTQLQRHEQIKEEKLPLFNKLGLPYDDNRVYYKQLVMLDKFIDFVKTNGRVPVATDATSSLYSWWKNKINARFTMNEFSRAKWNPEFVKALKKAGLPDLFKQARDIPDKYSGRKHKH